MKPASKNLHNKDMIIPCRFHKAKKLNKNNLTKPASKNLHNKDMIISCRFHTANILINK